MRREKDQKGGRSCRVGTKAKLKRGFKARAMIKGNLEICKIPKVKAKTIVIPCQSSMDYWKEALNISGYKSVQYLQKYPLTKCALNSSDSKSVHYRQK
jgi:hypothetical protein